MTRPVIVIDTETTSLTPDHMTGAGVVWELAMIERDCGTERLYRTQPNVALADPAALKVGRYTERTASMRRPTFDEDRANDGMFDLTQPQHANIWSNRGYLGPHVAGLLDRATLVAANPSFDAGFLADWLDLYGLEPTWHYRLRDIGSMAWAWLQAHHLPHHLDTPAIDASTDDLARAMGVDPTQFERHSALGDCRLVAAMLDVIEFGAAS